MKTFQTSRVVLPLNRNLATNPCGAGEIEIECECGGGFSLSPSDGERAGVRGWRASEMRGSSASFPADAEVRNSFEAPRYASPLTLDPSPHPTGRGKVRFFILAGLIALALLPLLAHAIPTNSPPRVLILDETVTGGAASQEAVAAVLAIPGCAVDVVSAANWYGIPATGTGGPTGFGFDQYRALIIGDPLCQNGPGYIAGMNALNATKALWTPACNGNVIIEGVDNAWHAAAASIPSAMAGADKTLKRGIAFAVNDPTKTGLYYAMSCFYDTTLTPVVVPHLSGFGIFKVRGYGTCFNDAHIVATHPILTAAPPLTDAELSGWSCSTHEGFTVWPPSFTVLAIALTNGAYTATDGSNGIPYMLIRGEGVQAIGPIELGPTTATNDLGTTHTVCATISTNVSPRTNVLVTFTISTGPNSVTNASSLTDSNGVACFTYTGNGGLGVDYITASYTNNLGQILSSGTVTKLWVGACVNIGCPALQCTADGVWTYSFCVTNLGASSLMALSLFNAPAGVSFAPSTLWLSPPLGAGQGTNLTVTINGPVALTNLCFKFGAYTTNEVVLDCSIPNCLNLPTCCTRVITNTLTFISTVGSVSTYNYSITIQNVTPAPVKFVGFAAAQPCVTFLPAILDLTLPAYGTNLLMPGQTRTLNLQVKRTAPCPGTNEFYLSTLDTNLVGCCSTRLKLPPAKCVQIILPYDKSYAVTNTAVLLRAAPIVSLNPCNFTWVKFYDGATFLGDASAGTSGYDLTVNAGFSAGTHLISAVAELEGAVGEPGEVETSEPIELIVITPNPPLDDHDH